jgi:hypothetical protein
MFRIPKPHNPLAHVAGVFIFLAVAVLFLLDGSIVVDFSPGRGYGHLLLGTIAMGAAWASLRELYTPRR